MVLFERSDCDCDVMCRRACMTAVIHVSFRLGSYRNSPFHVEQATRLELHMVHESRRNLIETLRLTLNKAKLRIQISMRDFLFSV